MNVALTDAVLPVRLRFERPMTDDELLDLKAEAIVFLSDVDVQAQIDRIAQALLDTDASITSDQVRAISQFTVTRAPSRRSPSQ